MGERKIEIRNEKLEMRNCGVRWRGRFIKIGVRKEK
jgi:hypothetical protein